MKVYDIIHDGVTYHLETVPEGGYIATVAGLPGCRATGATLDDTLARIEDARARYVNGHAAQPHPERTRDRRRSTRRVSPRGRPLTFEDSLWNIVGIGRSDGPTDVASNKHKYLADAYAAEAHRPEAE